MRVLIAPDHIDGLPAREVGSCLAAAWTGHDVVSVAMGEAGDGWVQAAADMIGAEIALLPAESALAMMAHAGDDLIIGVQAAPGTEAAQLPPIDVTASSAPLGVAVAQALDEAPDAGTVMVDLAGVSHHDAGAGFFAALGAQADGDLTGGPRLLSQLSQVDLTPVRDLLQDRRLIGIVPSAERGAHLLGLRGITSIAGREAGMAQTELLAIDGALEHFVQLTAATGAPELAAEAGAGACGGLGWAIRALGGEIVTGPGLSIQRHGLVRLAQQAELIVTGCSSYDFASRGGGVIAALAELAEQSMTPCVVLAGEVLIGSREMRTMGVEAAYPVFEVEPGPDPARTLREVAARVARTWSW